MESRRRYHLQEDLIPNNEFQIFSTALLLLTQLDEKNQQYQKRFSSLVKLCLGDKELDKSIIEKHVKAFIDKVKRKDKRIYGKEALDLRVITDSLATIKNQKNYLLRNKEFKYDNARQLINIVSKVINHFQLEELANLFKGKYFDQLNCVLIEKYLDPEHHPGELANPVARYASLLTTMHNITTPIKLKDIQSDKSAFKMQTGFRLIPKEKMNPRLPLNLKAATEKTPSREKYKISEEEFLFDVGEILSTNELLQIENNKHASKTPGPIYLSSFPIESSLNPKTETIPDLIHNYKIRSVVTIEEKIIAEYIVDDEIKALPSDWLKHGVSVGLVQCPDLHALRLYHDLLVAQYLFSEVLILLPSINKTEYTDLIKKIMSLDLQNSNNVPKINKSLLPTMFNNLADSLSANEKKYFDKVMTKLEWNNQEASSSQPKNNVLIHCKAGMSRSATALLSMYILFVDVFARWHSNIFIQDDKDKRFFGAIFKALFSPSCRPTADVQNIIKIFNQQYRPIKLIPNQVESLAQLIQCKRSMLLTEANKLRKTTTPENEISQNCFSLNSRGSK